MRENEASDRGDKVKKRKIHTRSQVDGWFEVTHEPRVCKSFLVAVSGTR